MTETERQYQYNKLVGKIADLTHQQTIIYTAGDSELLPRHIREKQLLRDVIKALEDKLDVTSTAATGNGKTPHAFRY